jgi:hypothetical protein
VPRRSLQHANAQTCNSDTHVATASDDAGAAGVCCFAAPCCALVTRLPPAALHASAVLLLDATALLRLRQQGRRHRSRFTKRCAAARSIFLRRLWRHAHAEALARLRRAARYTAQCARQRCGLSWLCFSCACACLVLTCPVRVVGVVGWCARHGVGEAHGRGGRAVCGGEGG